MTTMYHVRAPDGTMLHIQGPDGADPAEVLKQAQTLHLGVSNGEIKKPETFMEHVGDEVGGFGRAALSAVPFADDAAALADTVVPQMGIHGSQSGFTDPRGFWHAFSANDANEKNQAARSATARPLASIPGTIAGTAAGALGVGRAAKAGAPMIGAPVAAAYAKLPNTVKTMLAGAGMGALSGASQGTSIPNRVDSALKGAAAGAAGGGVIHFLRGGVAPAVAKVAGAVRNTDPQAVALTQMQKILTNEGYDVTSAAGKENLAKALADAGPNASLADVSSGLRARTLQAFRTPGATPNAAPAFDAIQTRAAGQGPRLAAAITAPATAVAPRTDVHALDAALIAQKAQAAGPLRDAALLNKVPVTPDNPTGVAPVVPDDPILQGLARTQYAQAALKGSKANIQQQLDTANLLGEPTDHLTPLSIIDSEPGTPLDMRALDLVKRNLQTKASAAFNSTDSAERANGPVYKNLANAIKTRMMAVGESAPGAQDGPYAKYLDAYAGPAASQDALDAGRSFHTQDPETIASEQAARSPAEQELYRVGVARNLMDRINGTPDGSYPADNLLASPQARAQLAATGVDPTALDALTTKLTQERNLNALPKAVGASPSSLETLPDTAIPTHIPWSPENIMSIIAAGARHLVKPTIGARNAAVASSILPALTSTDPTAITGTVNDIVSNAVSAQQAAAARQAQSMAAAKMFGLAVGSPVSVSGGPQ